MRHDDTVTIVEATKKIDNMLEDLNSLRDVLSELQLTNGNNSNDNDTRYNNDSSRNDTIAN